MTEDILTVVAERDVLKKQSGRIYGTISGGNLYVRGYHDPHDPAMFGIPDREPWVVELESGTAWSCKDVTFTPDEEGIKSKDAELMRQFHKVADLQRQIKALESQLGAALVRVTQQETVVAERDRYRAALESMVAAFDGEGYGDKSIVEETRKAALKCAIEDLGWDRTAPFPERHPELPAVKPDLACQRYLYEGCHVVLCDKHAERRDAHMWVKNQADLGPCDDCERARLDAIMRETDHLETK